jgi:hypothetical protein
MRRTEIVANIRGRMALCRRLSQTTSDPWAANALKKLVEEGERDIRRLETETDA